MNRPISDVIPMTILQAGSILNGLAPWALTRLAMGLERYKHLCSIPTSAPASEYLEQDRIRYAHMVRPGEAGEPMGSADDCVIFLSEVTDLTFEKCLAYQMRHFPSLQHNDIDMAACLPSAGQ